MQQEEQTALGIWLEGQLAERQMSQRKLYYDTGIAQAVISNTIAKGHIPTPGVLGRLADYFNVSIFHVYRLAGHLPSDLRLENADPRTVAVLEDTARIIKEFPPGAQERILRTIQTLVATLKEVEVEATIN